MGSVFSFQVEKNVLFSDNILYKAANATAVIPQYHPKHLTALMNLGKMRRVRAILCHLVNFLPYKYVTKILKEFRHISGHVLSCLSGSVGIVFYLCLLA